MGDRRAAFVEYEVDVRDANPNHRKSRSSLRKGNLKRNKTLTSIVPPEILRPESFESPKVDEQLSVS